MAVALTRAERRKRNHLERQAVEQVGAEFAFLDLPGEALIGRRHDPHVDTDRFGRPDAGDFAIFGGAQQPVLRRHRQGAELVKKKSTAVGFFKAPMACLCGAGEASGLMAEQLSFDEIFRQRSAVHDNQRPRPARRQMVKTLGDQFLAGSALADDEHRPIERCRSARALDCVEKRQALADELFRSLHVLTDCWWQIPPFGKDFCAPQHRKDAKIRELCRFRKSGTALVW